MCEYGKRLAALAAFVVVASALFPIWSPGQSPLQFQLDEHTRQLANLQTVPVDIAVLKNQMQAVQSAVDSQNTKLWSVIIGGALWMAKEMFQMLGGKIGMKKGEDS